MIRIINNSYLGDDIKWDTKGRIRRKGNLFVVTFEKIDGSVVYPAQISVSVPCMEIWELINDLTDELVGLIIRVPALKTHYTSKSIAVESSSVYNTEFTLVAVRDQYILARAGCGVSLFFLNLKQDDLYGN